MPMTASAGTVTNERRCTMQIVTRCRERASVLLQISKESEQFKKQAAFLAREWLIVASLRERFVLRATQTDREDRPRD